MSVHSSEPSFPDASSPVHAQSNPCCCGSGEDSPEGQESKSSCLVKSSSVRQCLGFESEAGVSSLSDYDLLYETIEGLESIECGKSKKGFRMRRKMCRSDCKKIGTEKRRENVYARRQACNCVASFAADCAAVCCCPCAILHIFVLAFVKAPSVLARKASCFAKKRARGKRKLEQKKTNDDESGDESGEKSRYYTPPWSCRSLQRGAVLWTDRLVPNWTARRSGQSFMRQGAWDLEDSRLNGTTNPNSQPQKSVSLFIEP